ncbi:serine/threonine protein kinase [Terrilactibacillus tamarindi]|nr:protein kinase [Terrilactibacillus tamarindi]
MTMKPMMMDQDIKLHPGTRIYGKWHKKTYQIMRHLGSGAQGTVYLAHSNQGEVAIKFSKDPSSLISEVNILKRFVALQGDPLGPYLYDVDDWVTNKGTINFYVMERIKGVTLDDSIRHKGFEWVYVFILQLLKDLSRLHELGFVFGDLKPENLMITESNYRIRCLDFGGTTQLGHSIKEYTEFFDRGYWGMGTRKAEPSYDLFAVMMIFIYAAERRRFNKTEHPRDQLIQKIKTNPKLKPFEKILLKALAGQFHHANDMRQAFLYKMNETNRIESRITRRRTATSPSKKRYQKKKTVSGWIGASVWAVVIIALYVMYTVLYVM